ncbi:monooxygenase [Mycena floridula]|nr:monooxygenase [Mycena floridula]
MQKIFFAILFLIPFAFAEHKCPTTLAERKEWRTLSRDEKHEYIRAVQCLQDKPATGINKAAKTRFDDMQNAHIVLADEVHLVGQFLPWHRRYIQVYENALRHECGFKGASPYWDWSLDADKGSVSDSPVFDPVDGFGGNGAEVPGYAGPFGNMSSIPGWRPGTGGGCIKDGPFAYYNLSLGPGTLAENHCIVRAFNDAFLPKVTSKRVRETLQRTSFETFRIELEGFPVTPVVKIHDAGHYLVNGEMSNVYSSPGDPIFYLHHANLDRIWWQWQSANLTHRLYAMSGRSSVDPPFKNVTLDFQLKMVGLAPLIAIREVMNIESHPLCYTYV